MQALHTKLNSGFQPKLNSLEFPAAGFLYSNGSCLSQLRLINLAANGLTDAGIVAIINSVAQVSSAPPQLQLIDISSNQVMSESAVPYIHGAGSKLFSTMPEGLESPILEVMPSDGVPLPLKLISFSHFKLKTYIDHLTLSGV